MSVVFPYVTVPFASVQATTLACMSRTYQSHIPCGVKQYSTIICPCYGCFNFHAASKLQGLRGVWQGTKLTLDYVTCRFWGVGAFLGCHLLTPRRQTLFSHSPQAPDMRGSLAQELPLKAVTLQPMCAFFGLGDGSDLYEIIAQTGCMSREVCTVPQPS